MSSSEILRKYSSKLSAFERSEIKYYKKIYFLGISADKVREGKNNWGFDNNEYLINHSGVRIYLRYMTTSHTDMKYYNKWDKDLSVKCSDV